MKKITLNSTSPHNVKVQNGPSIRSTTSPAAFFILNDGLHMDHSCSIEPTRLPGGAETSIV